MGVGCQEKTNSVPSTVLCQGLERDLRASGSPHSTANSKRIWSGHPDLDFADEKLELGRTGMSWNIPSLA